MVRDNYCEFLSQGIVTCPLYEFGWIRIDMTDKPRINNNNNNNLTIIK